MREAGFERPAGDYVIFDGADKSTRVIGRVVAVGLADEINDRQYLVVDGIDGRVHYAETTKLAPEDVPAKSMIVALSGSSGKGRMRNSRIEVLSYWQLEKLPVAEVMTWLDKVVVESKELAFREHGFGLEVKSALAERRHWRMAQGLAVRETDHSVTPKPRLLHTLFNRELAQLEQDAARQAGVPSYRVANDAPMRGRYQNGRND